MRISLALLLALTGCTSISQVGDGIEVSAYPRNCIDTGRSEKHSLKISNGSNSAISFGVSSRSSPYQLHRHSANLLYDSPPLGERSFFHATMTDYTEFDYVKTSEPGKTAIFQSVAGGWPGINDDFLFYWQVTDKNGVSYLSSQIRLCK